ncbi:hypothetical protein LJR231_006441 [Phyllobacterium sp. LjRoot231]|uniref:hypothetical protein n=1 Tax=Phyllobacterium sp. LjRoot231 TaxID=3342289 RepID=UPI003ED12DC6
MGASIADCSAADGLGTYRPIPSFGAQLIRLRGPTEARLPSVARGGIGAAVARVSEDGSWQPWRGIEPAHQIRSFAGVAKAKRLLF